MKKILSDLKLRYAAEHIKLRGTGFYTISIILGAFSPIFYFIIILAGDQMPNQTPENYYREFIHQILFLFTHFFLPMLIIISISRITQFDHRNGGWQLMETQPLSRFSIYFSKYLVVLKSSLVSIIVMIGFGYGFGFILTLVQEIPAGVSTSIDVLFIPQLITRLLVASLFLTSFQYFISVLIQGFIWPILAGFSCIVVLIFLNKTNVSPDWYPNDIIGRIYKFKDGSDLGYWFTYTEIYSLVMAILISAFGFQWYRLRKFRLAFVSGKRLLISGIILFVGSALIMYLLRPNEMPLHNRTVISGQIESTRSFKKVSVISVNHVDTLAIIPVKDNAFKFVTEENFLFDLYKIYLDDIDISVYMGRNDSTFIFLKLWGNTGVFNIRGTRVAENNPGSQLVPFADFNDIINDNRNLDRPDVISDILYGEWNEDMSIPIFKTVDNYVAKNDFRDREIQVQTVLYLNAWNDFMRRRGAVRDTTHDVMPDKIKLMKSRVLMRNEALLSEDEYIKYVLTDLTSRITDRGPEKDLLSISTLEKGDFKDKLLFAVLRRAIFYASDNADREKLLNTYLEHFKDVRYGKILSARSSSAESLSRGKPAPVFVGLTLDNKTVTQSDLKGKITVIDVWASWCAPCKIESPHFERLALKYASDKVQFVALSVDEKVENWKIDAQSHSKAVLQMVVLDFEKFMSNYGILGIPHYLIIDSDGNILNANLPSPVNSNFEVILKNELGIK